MNILFWIVFVVLSFIDLRMIFDMGGVEKLFGWGDMLLFLVGFSKFIWI